MKIVFLVSLMFLMLFLFSGCRYYSWMVLENPEFPDAKPPIELDTDLLNKYTVGEVIVQPRIIPADSAQTTYKLRVLFFSKTTTPVVSVKTVTLSIKGMKLEYGKQLVNELTSDWRLSPSNKPFYVCGISGAPIDRPKAEMDKDRVDVLLVVSVKDENGKITEKKIDSFFQPTKRSYLE